MNFKKILSMALVFTGMIISNIGSSEIQKANIEKAVEKHFAERENDEEK